MKGQQPPPPSMRHHCTAAVHLDAMVMIPTAAWNQVSKTLRAEQLLTRKPEDGVAKLEHHGNNVGKDVHHEEMSPELNTMWTKSARTSTMRTKPIKGKALAGMPIERAALLAGESQRWHANQRKGTEMKTG